MEIFTSYLTWIILLPVIGALALYIFPEKPARWVALLFTALTLALSIWVFIDIASAGNFGDITHLQHKISLPWISFQAGNLAFKINWALGVDGLSLPLVILNAFLTLLAIVGGWEKPRV